MERIESCAADALYTLRETRRGAAPNAEESAA